MASVAPIINGQFETGFPAAIVIGADFGPFAILLGQSNHPRVVPAAHCGADIPLELVVQSGLALAQMSPLQLKSRI